MNEQAVLSPDQPVLLNNQPSSFPQGGLMESKQRKMKWVTIAVVVLVLIIGGGLFIFRNIISNQQQSRWPDNASFSSSNKQIALEKVDLQQATEFPHHFKFYRDDKDFEFLVNKDLTKYGIGQAADEDQSVISPDKSKKTYVKDLFLYVSNFDGSNPIKIIQVVYDEDIPVASVDGGWGYLLGPMGNSSIAWSLDSSTIYFAAAPNHKLKLFQSSIDGSKIKELAYVNNDYIYSLQVSPDNKYVSFLTTSSFGSGAGHTAALYIWNTKDTTLTRISDGKLPNGDSASPISDPRWINSSTLLFYAWNMISASGLWKVDANTKKITLFLDKSFGEPIWHNNDFVAGEDDQMVVCVNGKLSDPIKLPNNINGIIWSKDGQDILYTLVDANERSAIYRLPINTLSPQLVKDNLSRVKSNIKELENEKIAYLTEYNLNIVDPGGSSMVFDTGNIEYYSLEVVDNLIFYYVSDRANSNKSYRLVDTDRNITLTIPSN